MFIRKVAKAIIDDINNNPNNWRPDDGNYTITNGKIQVWIKNGAWAVFIWDNGSHEKIFNYFERRAIYKAYKKLIKQREEARKIRLSDKIIESLTK
jgi:hypothetical protein